MSLTPEQLATLRADILASTDPDVVAARGTSPETRNDVELQRLYNLDSTFVVWRTSVAVNEYRAAITWTEVDALTVGKARIWDWITAQMTLPLNASVASVRQGLADCWGAQTATRAGLIAAGKRFATRCEALFATGTGTSGTPGALVFEGQVSLNDISNALN
jgi:hypothetical protein